MKHLLTLIVTAAIASSAATPLPVRAHGGEDHGDEVAAIPTAVMAPRAIAETAEFELVAVLEGKKLSFTLDRFATNEPVADAQIEVESGALKAVATQVAPGVYSIPGESFVPPGKYPLAISVQAGESADLLTATLDLSTPVTAGDHVHATSEWVIWSAAAALLLAGGGLAARHRRKNRSKGLIT